MTRRGVTSEEFIRAAEELGFMSKKDESTATEFGVDCEFKIKGDGPTIAEIEKAMNEGRPVQIQPDGTVVIGQSFEENLEELWWIHPESARRSKWAPGSITDLLYLGMKASSELGECTNLVGKIVIADNLSHEDYEALRMRIREEMGDTLVFMHLLCRNLNLSFEECISSIMTKVRAKFPIKPAPPPPPFPV
jgi:NTP pyrophosphatase (non-canonical NTP hydrolase)